MPESPLLPAVDPIPKLASAPVAINISNILQPLVIGNIMSAIPYYPYYQQPQQPACCQVLSNILILQKKKKNNKKLLFF
jgi:hypothetical protein